MFYVLILFITWSLSSIFAMAGVGAANTLVPTYFSLGIPLAMASASGLLLNIFSLSSATVNNAKNHNIDWKLGTIFVIPAVIMAPVGALLEPQTPRKILLVLFVAFLSITMLNLLRGKPTGRSEFIRARQKGPIAIAIGGLAGFLGGILGIGGGLIILPVLTFLEEDFKRVSGTSGYVALFISASGFLAYLRVLSEGSYTLWAVIVAGGILGGWTGSVAMNKFKSRTIRYVIVTVVAIVTLKLLYSILT